MKQTTKKNDSANSASGYPAELIGKWLYVQYFDNDGKVLEYRETWTFHKNGILKWTEEEVGFGKSECRYKYVIDGNKLITTDIVTGIKEEEMFSVDGDILAMYTRSVDEVYVLRKTSK